MRTAVWAALTVAVFSATAWAVEKPAAKPQTGPVAAAKEMTNPMITIKTSMGTIEAELWADKAPATVKNFLSYVSDGHYDGLIFHRVIPKFMVQGGGFSPDMKQKDTKPPVKNEARKDVPNDRGTLAMARTMVVDSATSQFFINLVDNDFLNHKDKTPRGFGYCAFGKVTKGMDVVDSIAKVSTGTKGPHRDVPTEPVVIESVTVQE